MKDKNKFLNYVESYLAASGDYHPMGNIPGFPVLHQDRGIYRKSNRENLAADIESAAKELWPHLDFKVRTMGARIRVSVSSMLDGEDNDWFVLSSRDLTDDFTVIESPEGMFEPELDAFKLMVRRLM